MRMLVIGLAYISASNIASAAPYVLYSVELPFNYHFAGQPALNDSDQIAVLAAHGDTYEVLSVTSSTTNILYASTITQPTGHSGAAGFLPADPAINAAGEVAFESDSLDTSSFAVYKWTSGALSTLTSGTSGGGHVTQQGINDAGNVVFASRNMMTVFTSGSPSVTAAPTFTRQTSASIDSQGRLLYAREVTGPGPLSYQMRAVDGGGDHLLSSGVAPSGSPFHNLKYSINDAGFAAYVTGLGIYLTSIDDPTPSLLATGPAAIARIAINDTGDLAFSTIVSISNGPDAHLYYQLAGASSPIHLLGTGDPFLGGTLSYALIGSGSLNDHQHLAVGYELTNGRVGVAVLAIPELSSLVLAAIVALAGVVVVGLHSPVRTLANGRR